jgi:kynurenine formamidase
MSRRKRIMHTENLMNLDRLIGRRFGFVGLPLTIRDGYRSPVCVVAFINEPMR